MNPTHARDTSTVLAKTDWRQARDMAHQISDPWFACQALAAVARFAPAEDVGWIADEAMTVANQSDDIYRQIAVTAWPLRALLERGEDSRVGPMVHQIVGRAAAIRPPASHAEALFILLSSVFPGGRKLWQPVWEELLQTSLPTTSWRQGRAVRESFLMVASEDLQLARELSARLPLGKLRQRVERQLDAGEQRAPRGFFHEDP